MSQNFLIMINLQSRKAASPCCNCMWKNFKLFTYDFFLKPLEKKEKTREIGSFSLYLRLLFCYLYRFNYRLSACGNSSVTIGGLSLGTNLINNFHSLGYLSKGCIGTV